MPRSLRRALTLRDFLTAPVGAALSGESFVFANLGTLCGWRVWGTPSLAEARELIAALETAYAPGSPTYCSLVDLRGLQQVDGTGFEVLQRFVEKHREEMAEHLRRQAGYLPLDVGFRIGFASPQLRPFAGVFAAPALRVESASTGTSFLGLGEEVGADLVWHSLRLGIDGRVSRSVTPVTSCDLCFPGTRLADDVTTIQVLASIRYALDLS